MATPPVPRSRRAWSVAAAAFGLILAVSGVSFELAHLSGGHPKAEARNLAALVDPFVGTGSGGQIEGRVAAFPGASMPFGMMAWSPDTPTRPAGGGYYYADSAITGFSLTHVSGPGCGIAGNVPVLPVAGPMPSGNLTKVSEPFRHSSETAHPGSYAVTAGGVRTQLAVTDRTGLARFTYPASGDERLLVKVADSDSGTAATTFRVSGDREITGSVTTGHFCGRPDTYTVYFAARFSRPFTATGTWHLKGGTVAGAWLDFGAARPRGVVSPLGPGGTAAVARTVGMQAAVSYTSAQGARRNLAAEARTWNVGAVAARATAAWNRQLGTVSVGGGSPGAERKFYTALYHASLEPSLFSDADGEYTGFDGAVHRVRPGHAQYTDFSGWDIYRSQVPLLATIDPKRAGDMAASLLNDAAQGGALPKWVALDADTDIMNGDSAAPILAGAYAFGARGFDASAALMQLIIGAKGGAAAGVGPPRYAERPHATAYIDHGYVPNVWRDSGSRVRNGASETLEYAIDDFAVSRLARNLGDTADAATFARRSQNWANLFDVATGYIEPRDAAGAFPAGPPVKGTNPFSGQDGFEEGNAAQYTWLVPQNLAGLIHGIGGDRAAVARLDAFFTKLNVGAADPHAWMGNEIELGTPWIYDSAGQPWKTQALVKRITGQLYSLTPGGEPGNDDLGALSSWYVWATLGLYPQTPGVPMLVLGTPQFPHEVIHGAFGDLTVKAPSAGADTYVRGLTVDGRPTGHTYIDVTRTRELDFTLSKTPVPGWGSAPADAPPSFPAGGVRVPRDRRGALGTGRS